MTDDRQAILLFDGLCGLCHRAVQFILAHETKQTLKFSSLHSSFANQIIQRHPALRSVDSLVFVEGDILFTRSDAVKKCIEYLGGAWKILLLFWLFPARLRNGVYDTVARNRHKIFETFDVCPIPDKKIASRFIE